MRPSVHVTMTPMDGFVDLHTHVLHGLDDGAKTRDDSLEMLRIAEANGTTDLVATPHANSRFTFDPALIDRRIAELAPHTGVRLHRGCDFHLHVSNIEDALANPGKYTIDHGPYLLVELPATVVPSGTDRILMQLLDAGMLPIVTHPERNGHLQRHTGDLVRWIGLGCAVQVTAASLTGLFGRAARASAHALVKAGLAHFVASDAHDAEVRTPSLREAYACLIDLFEEDRVRALFVENPRAVLEGDELDVDAPPPAARKRRWYQFW